VIPLNDAVMFAFPSDTPVTNPANTVAMPLPEEVQVAEEVRFCVEPSVYVPVAVNCVVLPMVSMVEVGLRLMETSDGPVTVRMEVPLIEPDMAVMLLVPWPTPVARPALDMVATVVVDDVHVAEFVRFCVLPSL
jgi:hypothetical protein